MDFEGFAKLVKGRRTVRRFRPDPIPDEYIQKILEVARWSPSGANAQPWEFIVIKDQAMKKNIEDLFIRTHNTRSRVWESTRREDLKHWAQRMEKTNIADAPAIIVPTGDVRTVYASAANMHCLYPGRNLENMTNVTLLIHLAATALGLGARWVSFDEPSMGPLKTLLGIPDTYHVYSIVPIGYPAHKPALPYRRDLSEMVHYDRYDMSKCRSDEKLIEYIAELRKHTRPAYIFEPGSGK